MLGRRPYRQVIDGVPRCPNINPDLLRKNLSFRATKGDVLQISYPKSGTHWLHYITQLIITKGKPVSTFSEFSRHCRVVEYTECADWKSDLPARLFVTHLPLRRETMNDDAKYIYMARNPWDVCVSLYRMMSDLSVYQFQDGTFEEFFDAFVEGDLGHGSYFDHVMSGYVLRQEPNVFFVTYEELTKDTQRTVLRLAHFLGEQYGRALEEDEQMMSNVLEWSKSENMKKIVVLDLAVNDTPEWQDFASRTSMNSKTGYAGDKNKYAIVKDAKVGSWKNYFTPPLLARFEKIIQDQGEKAGFLQLWSDIHKEVISLARLSK